MIAITEPDDSRIGLYRNLKDLSFTLPNQHLFIAEASIVTKKLLQSDIEIVSIFALPEFYDSFADLINNKKIPEEHQYIADKKVMNEIVGFRLHQGIMAIGKIPAQTPILDLTTPIVVLNGIVNSENVGAIVRNAVAFGFKSIITDKATSSPFLRRSVRVSMGSVFSIQYFQSENLDQDLSLMEKEKGIEIVASELIEEARTIENFKFKKQTAIIFGSEGKGISKDILSICDKVVYIPISSEVDSLNVAASSAIIFHRLKNQMI